MNDNEQPHRRYDPLRDRWVLVSPHRTQRPWEGQQETVSAPEAEYLPDCYLCPGNERANGESNPDYQDVYVFDNDFPALLPTSGHQENDQDPFYRRQNVSGRCRVICYSPRHDLTLASMEHEGVLRVVDTWADEVTMLSREHEWVQVFENRGAAMGCSNMHPHGQIWALDSLPQEAAIEDQQQAQHLAKHGRNLLLDYAEREIAAGERIVVHNDEWLAVVPWWAEWPFETLLLPRFPAHHLPALSADGRASLAKILGALLRTYDRLFATPFPYSMGWHGSPGARPSESWQLHAHFYPPLLRSATVRKHRVGFEMLGEAQRDLTPETAAERLRDAAI